MSATEGVYPLCSSRGRSLCESHAPRYSTAACWPKTLTCKSTDLDLVHPSALCSGLLHATDKRRP